MPKRPDDKPPAMRVLQLPVTAAFLRELKAWVIRGGTTLKDFVPAALGAATGLHHETGKPLKRVKP